MLPARAAHFFRRSFKEWMQSASPSGTRASQEVSRKASSLARGRGMQRAIEEGTHAAAKQKRSLFIA